MSILKKHELQALVKAKMHRFCKANNITLTEFLTISGITTPKWHRISNGKDVYFSSIVAIVKQTKGFFSFEDLAAILDDAPLPNWVQKIEKITLEKIVEKKIQTIENEKTYGKDPLDIK